MNPIVSLDLAKLDIEERRRQADAWRASAGGRRAALRVRLGVTLQHLGARLAGTTAPVPSVHPRGPAVRLS